MDVHVNCLTPVSVSVSVCVSCVAVGSEGSHASNLHTP
jgi:hypothetical protein